MVLSWIRFGKISFDKVKTSRLRELFSKKGNISIFFSLTEPAHARRYISDKEMIRICTWLFKRNLFQPRIPILILKNDVLFLTNIIFCGKFFRKEVGAKNMQA